MNEKNYQQTLDYLFQQLPMFQRIGSAAYKKDLSNITALCKMLGQPHLKYPTIHIAGTNGKGSTAHILAAILQAHGLRVGLHTSPHYRDFRERIKINGTYASEGFVIDFVEKYKDNWVAIQPSFFELSMAMAFHYFAEQKVDIAIIETGLGGELDSSNVVSPVLSIITNISYDHQQFLGNTLPEIASAKAGIIKNQTPTVIGEQQQETKAVFDEKAKMEHAPIIYADQHYRAEWRKSDLYTSVYQVFKNGALKYENLEVNLIGNYQQYNLQTALQAIEWIPSEICEIEERKLREGLSNIKSLTNFIGRWQVLSEQPLVLGDSAHNEAGIQAAMQYLESFTFDKLHLVLGFANDKDLSKILSFFPKNATYYFAKANIPRGLEADKLQVFATQYQLRGKAYASVSDALAMAKKQAMINDLVYVGGSIFVLAEVV